MADQIPEWIIEERWRISEGKCECCGKNLIWKNKGFRDQEVYGSWEPHHRFPDRDSTVDNIRIVCNFHTNCHKNCCHKGNWANIPPIWSPCNYWRN